MFSDRVAGGGEVVRVVNHPIQDRIGQRGILTNLVVPSTYSLLQTLVPERMRAVAIATVFFISALIGNGLGPLASGALSDALRPRFGDESLRYALFALSPGYL